MIQGCKLCRTVKVSRIRKNTSSELPYSQAVLLDAPQSHLVRWVLTCFGLKGDPGAADAGELMGVNPQMVGGAGVQIRYSYWGLLHHWYALHYPLCLLALETQQSGQSHSPRGVAMARP